MQTGHDFCMTHLIVDRMTPAWKLLQSLGVELIIDKSIVISSTVIELGTCSPSKLMVGSTGSPGQLTQPADSVAASWSPTSTDG